MAKITVLGGGMVGNAIARVMAEHHHVRLVDRDPTALRNTSHPRIKKIKADLRDKSVLSKVITGSDLVIGAVPGFMGFEVMKQVIESGYPMVDISFFPENGLSLDKLAKKKKVTVIYDCGVAPGMHNILLGHHDFNMQVKLFSCCVGGLPKIRNLPFDYKAPFSPADVLEEYTRPARLKENGVEIVKPALTDLEYIRAHRGLKLEAFNSDGLRSLLITMNHIPDMKEKTLRYPGHAAQMEFLREAGLLDKKTKRTKLGPVVPLELTSQLLFKHWKYKPEEEDFIFMRTIIEGLEQGKKVRYTYDLYDEYDKTTKMSAMARTTGLTACAVAEMVLDKKLLAPGVYPPETLGRDTYCFDFILDYLKKRNIHYKKKKKLL